MNMQAVATYMNLVARQPNQLGVLDCVRFVAEMLYLGWGRDYRDALQYEDRRSAVNRLRAAGGLRNACSDVLGMQRPGSELRCGDVAYFDDPPTIGIILPGYCAVKFGRTIQRINLSHVESGWRS